MEAFPIKTVFCLVEKQGVLVAMNVVLGMAE